MVLKAPSWMYSPSSLQRNQNPLGFWGSVGGWQGVTVATKLQAPTYTDQQVGASEHQDGGFLASSLKGSPSSRWQYIHRLTARSPQNRDTAALAGEPLVQLIPMLEKMTSAYVLHLSPCCSQVRRVAIPVLLGVPTTHCQAPRKCSVPNHATTERGQGA